MAVLDRRAFLLSTGALALGAAAPVLPAAEVDKVQFSDRLKAGRVMLRLNGAGLVYYKAIIKGLAAGLYGPLATGGSVVLCRHLERAGEDALAQRIESERVTATAR